MAENSPNQIIQNKVERRPKTHNLNNLKFGKLLVMEFHSYNKYNYPQWLCKCECGTEKVILGTSLRSGNTKSCGCAFTGKKHGLHNHRIYNIWEGMKQRCLNPKAKYYKHYGGRGIQIDPNWMKFENFYNDMKGGYAEDLTLERNNVNGHYCKDNCSWSTMTEQHNNRRDNVLLTINGVTGTITKWANIVGINRQTIVTRYHRGYSHYECVYGKDKVVLN